MTDNERDARAAEAARIWHDVALRELRAGDVNAAIAALYQYGAALDRIAANA